MADTKRGEYKFTVKEYHDGTPWIAFEPLHKTLEIDENGMLGFDLANGTSYEKAEEIARFLNKNIKSLAHTTF